MGKYNKIEDMQPSHLMGLQSLIPRDSIYPITWAKYIATENGDSLEDAIGISVQVVDELPDDAQKGSIYALKTNKYKIYLFDSVNGVWYDALDTLFSGLPVSFTISSTLPTEITNSMYILIYAVKEPDSEIYKIYHIYNKLGEFTSEELYSNNIIKKVSESTFSDILSKSDKSLSQYGYLVKSVVSTLYTYTGTEFIKVNKASVYQSTAPDSLFKPTVSDNATCFGHGFMGRYTAAALSQFTLSQILQMILFKDSVPLDVNVRNEIFIVYALNGDYDILENLLSEHYTDKITETSEDAVLVTRDISGSYKSTKVITNATTDTIATRCPDKRNYAVLERDLYLITASNENLNVCAEDNVLHTIRTILPKAVSSITLNNTRYIVYTLGRCNNNKIYINRTIVK